MTTIKETIKTFELIGDDMIHTGYFIITNNHAMKYATKWVWESATAQNDFRINVDRYVSRLERA
jgi:hypothetical protein